MKIRNWRYFVAGLAFAAMGPIYLVLFPGGLDGTGRGIPMWIAVPVVTAGGLWMALREIRKWD